MNNMEPDTGARRDGLLRALQIISLLGEKRVDPDELRDLQDEQLVGMLDVAVESLALRLSRTGKGKSRRYLFVKGHREYLAAHNDDRALMRFYQSRIDRIAVEMKSALNDFPA